MALPENLLRARERKLSGSRALNRQLVVQKAREKRLEKNALKQTALNIDQQFRTQNFGGSLTNFNKEYNKIPDNIRKYMKLTPTVVQNEIQKNIEQINSLMRASVDKEKRYSKKGDDIGKAGERAKQKGLREALNFYQKGEIISINDILNYVTRLRSNARKEERETIRLLKQRKETETINKGVIVKTGDKSVTYARKIDPKTGKIEGYLVNGKLQKTEPKTGYKVIVPKIKRQQGIFQVSIVDPRTNIRTTKNFNLGKNNKLIDKKTSLEIKQFLGTKTNLTKEEIEKFQKGNIIEREILRIKDLQGRNVSGLGEQKDIFGQTQKERNNLIKIKEELKIIKVPLTKAEKLINLEVTGQSMTPTQMAELNLIRVAEGKKLNTDTINNLKKVSLVIPAFVYGQNLVKRFNAGEKNPLFNDLKIITLGFGKEARDVFLSLFGVSGITTNSQGLSKDGLVAVVSRNTLQYGIDLFKSAKKGNAQKKLKNDLVKVVNAIVDTGTAITDTTKFIAENPVLTGLIIGSAIESGVIKSKKSFMNNPKENLGRALFWLVPSKYILAPIDKLGKITTLKVNPTFKVTQYISTNKLKVTGNFIGKSKDGTNFITRYELRFNPKTKQLIGWQSTKIGKKTTKTPLRFEDKGNYYLNLDTKEKVKKLSGTFTNKSIKLKNTTQIKTNQKNYILDGVPAVAKEYTINQTIVRIIDGSRKVITKQTGLVKITDKNKKILGSIIQSYNKTMKKTRTGKIRPLTSTQIKQLNNIIEFYGWNNLKGLDRRTKIAQALGIKPTNKKIDTIIKLIDDKGQLITKTKAGKIILKGEVPLDIPTKTFKLKFQKRKLSALKRNKSGQTSLLQGDNIQLLKKKTPKTFTNQKVFNIPNLSSKLPLNPTNLKFYGIAKQIAQVLSKIDKLKKINAKTNSEYIKKLSVRITDIKTDIIKIQNTIKKIDTKKIQKTVQTKKVKSVATNIKTKKLPIKKPIIRVKSPKIKTSPIKIKTIKFGLPKIKTKDKRTAYLIQVKRNTTTLKTNVRLPKYRALDLLIKYLQKYPQSKGKLIVKGKTQIKDINAFRVNKDIEKRIIK